MIVRKVIELVDVAIPNLWGILGMVFCVHVMRCVGGRWVDEAKGYMVVTLKCDGGSIKEERNTQGNVSE